MTQTAQVTQEVLVSEGNTLLRSRARHWSFTLNNYSDLEYCTILSYLIAKKYTYCIGKEVGENGTPHLQGFISFKNPISFNTIKKLIPKAHIEKCIGNQTQNFDYCSKDGDFVTNIVCKKEVNVHMKDVIVPRDWQIEIIDIIEKTPNARTINWICDTKGNMGKTTLCDYIISTYKDVMYFTGGKASDITSQVLLDQQEGNEIKLCLFDFCRSTEGFISYNALEALKNGLINSPKYKGGSLRLAWNPTIIVFANFKPDKKKLSQDRWRIIDLDETSSEFCDQSHPSD